MFEITTAKHRAGAHTVRTNFVTIFRQLMNAVRNAGFSIISSVHRLFS
jgi:hypothetical protein